MYFIGEKDCVNPSTGATKYRVTYQTEKMKTWAKNQS